MIPDALEQLLYLVSAVLFIVGLRRLGSPTPESRFPALAVAGLPSRRSPTMKRTAETK